MDEPTVAEDAHGLVWLNMRNNHLALCNPMSCSPAVLADCVASHLYPPPVDFNPELISPVCQGALVSVPQGHGDVILLFTNP
eukprot:gene283-11111_t